jgi:Rod binding domain-containing protein
MEGIGNIRDFTDISARTSRHDRERAAFNRPPRAAFHEQLRETIVAANINERDDNRAIPSDRRLWEACMEMESIFVGRMLKEMRNTLDPESRLIHGGQAEEIFTDMLYDQYALTLSKTSNLGIARLMYRELSGRQ